MMPSDKLKIRDHLRIIFTLAHKDLLNAIKNKNILTTLISIIFLIVLYRFMPYLEKGDILPTIAVFDPGGSEILSGLNEIDEIHVFTAQSEDQMKRYLANRDYVSVGVVFPEDFDQRRAEGTDMTVEGYFIYWADEGERRAVESKFERILSELAGVTVKIKSDGNNVFPTKNSTGQFFLVSISMIISFTMISFAVSPNLIIDEKQTKTLDVLRVSPAQSLHIILGKAFAGIIYCLLSAVLLAGISFQFITQWGVAVLCFLLGSLLFTTLGLILGTFTQTRQQLMIWLWVALPIMVFPAFLSIATGLIPDVLIKVLNYYPSVALAKLMQLSFLNTVPLSLLFPELGVVVGFTIMSIAILIVVLNRYES